MPRPFPVHDDAAYRRALALIDTLWDAPAGSPEADVLDVMATLVDLYEKRSRALPPADPRKVIAFKLAELGWSQRELGRRLGWGAGRVSEVLSGQRRLTLQMVKDLAATLGLPSGVLVHDVLDEAAGDGVWVFLRGELAARVAGAARPGEDVPTAAVRLLTAGIGATGAPSAASTSPRRRATEAHGGPTVAGATFPASPQGSGVPGSSGRKFLCAA